MGRTERVWEVPLDAAVWSPVAAGEARLALSSASAGGRPALRLDFDFKAGAGFVVARCPVQHAGVRGLRGYFPAARRGSDEQPRGQARRLDRAERLAARRRESAAARTLEALSHRQPRVRFRLGSGERRRPEGSRSDRARHRRGRWWRRYAMGQRPQDRGSRFAYGRAGERLERPPGLRCRSGARRVRLDPQPRRSAALDRRGLHRGAHARRAHHRLAGRRTGERLSGAGIVAWSALADAIYDDPCGRRTQLRLPAEPEDASSSAGVQRTVSRRRLAPPVIRVFPFDRGLLVQHRPA